MHISALKKYIKILYIKYESDYFMMVKIQAIFFHGENYQLLLYDKNSHMENKRTDHICIGQVDAIIL